MGFGDNARVLEWIVKRCDEDGEVVETPIGIIPDYKNGAIDISGLDLPEGVMDELFRIDPRTWTQEVDRQAAYQRQFGDRLPRGIVEQREKLAERLKNAM